MTPAMTQKLFSEIAPKFADRAGGYTRIIHGGTRVGDGAKVAILELVGYEFKKKERKKRARSKKPSKPKANPPPQRLHGPLREPGRAFLLPNRPKNGCEAGLPGGRGAPGDGSRARAFLRKPFTVKELSEKIEPLLAEKPEQAKTRGVREGLPGGA